MLAAVTPSPSSRPRAVPAPLPVRTISTSRPLAWLEAGLRDLARTPALSLAHGALFTLGCLVILVAGWRHFSLLAGAFTGFLLVAPVGATGLYALSRQLARGRPAGLADVRHAWARGGGGALRFGLMLAAVGTGWVLFSSLVLTGMNGQPWHGLQGFLAPVVLRMADLPARGHLFLMWLAAGGLLAAWVFAVSAVAMPLMLDRRVTMRTAMLTSARAVGQNPGAMGLWAGLILLLSVAGIVTLVGLAVLIPLLGHATWHAYAELVDSSDVPERT